MRLADRLHAALDLLGFRRRSGARAARGALWALAAGSLVAQDAQAQTQAPGATGSQPLQSLEAWLRGVRGRLAAVQSRLELEVRDLDRTFEQIELASEDAGKQSVLALLDSDFVRTLEERIASLGGEGAPLVVDWIDPAPPSAPGAAGPAAAREALAGSEAGAPGAGAPVAAPTVRERVRAELTTRGLARIPVASIEPRLAEILDRGSAYGRARAGRLLALSERPSYAGPLLVDAFRASEGELEAQLLRAVLAVRGSAASTLLDEVFAEDDNGRKQLALEALAELRRLDFEDRVEALLTETESARALAQPILGYYLACPEVCGKEELQALIALAADQRARTTARLAILEALPVLAGRVDSSVRSALESLREHRDPELREATLVALARLGDRRARREALAPYDQALDQNPDWAIRHLARAELLMRIEDWNGAIKGFKQALQVGRADPIPPKGAHVGIARCYARLEKLKDASSWLEQAPITTRELQALADDPAFEELRDHPRYGDVFRLGR